MTKNHKKVIMFHFKTADKDKFMAYNRNKRDLGEYMSELESVSKLEFMYKNSSDGLFAESKRHRGSPSLLEIRADNGDTMAMWDLALAYENGWGVKKDAAIAREWFEKQIESLKKQARSGDTDAMLKLANSYLYGWGVQKNPEEAEELFDKRIKALKERADAGNPQATLQLDREFYMN